VNRNTRQKFLRRKRRIARRLQPRRLEARARPMLAAGNIDYDLADRTRAVGCGGIGSVHLLARKVGLIDAIDAGLQLLKVHLPYHESDHVLNIAGRAGTTGTGIACRTWNCSATMRFTWTPWALLASPTRPPPGTSAGASSRPRMCGR
jgi:hypothetical protein